MGIDQESIKQYIGWKSNRMFHHYTVGNDMCSRYSSANFLIPEFIASNKNSKPEETKFLRHIPELNIQ
jgi:hypothetical protein